MNRYLSTVGLYARSSLYKILLIPYTVVAAIQMFLEPILEGAPIFMLSVVLLDGVVTNMNRMRQEDENSISV